LYVKEEKKYKREKGAKAQTGAVVTNFSIFIFYLFYHSNFFYFFVSIIFSTTAPVCDFAPFCQDLVIRHLISNIKEKKAQSRKQGR
jgi:hypothetical protein